MSANIRFGFLITVAQPNLVKSLNKLKIRFPYLREAVFFLFKGRKGDFLPGRKRELTGPWLNPHDSRFHYLRDLLSARPGTSGYYYLGTFFGRPFIVIATFVSFLYLFTRSGCSRAKKKENIFIYLANRNIGNVKIRFSIQWIVFRL